MARLAVRLHRKGRRAAVTQHLAQQAQPLGEARADDETIGRHADAAGPGEVVGEGAAQLRAPAWVGVAQGLVRRGGEGPARGGEPARAREGGQVRRPRPQVVARDGWPPPRRPAPTRPRPRRPGRRPACPSPAGRSASPPRRAGRTRRRRCSARVPGRGPACATTAAASRAAAARSRTASRRACSRPARTRGPARSRCRSIPKVAHGSDMDADLTGGQRCCLGSSHDDHRQRPRDPRPAGLRDPRSRFRPRGEPTSTGRPSRSSTGSSSTRGCASWSASAPRS